MDGETIHLYGAAAGARDYVFINDVVRAFVCALDAPAGTYDVGTSHVASLVEAATEVCRQTGHAWPTTGELHYSHAPVAQESRWLPGWKPQVTLQDGIARTVAAFQREKALVTPQEVAA